MNLDKNGQLVSTLHPITIGDPDEAYVMIPIEVGRAFQPIAGTNLASSFTAPNCEIKRPLSDNKSPVTLWLDGRLNEITLNGTADGNLYTRPCNLVLTLGREIS